MTYARSRLWLGITGVGSLVVLATGLLRAGTADYFPEASASLQEEIASIALVVLAIAVWLIPFDLLGGYVFPARYGRSVGSLGRFAAAWLRGVAVQSILFVAVGVAILKVGQWGGVAASTALVAIVALVALAAQSFIASIVAGGAGAGACESLAPVRRLLAARGIALRRARVIEHRDPGFTGGVVGLPGREVILVPRRWAQELMAPELAALLARRVEAVRSGSRRNGIALALVWTVGGFAVATTFPGAGVGSVAELVATLCGFTLWSFLGLLVLPSLSRRASYDIDARVIESGIPVEELRTALQHVEEFNEGEPERSVGLESIFHPVPCVQRRVVGKSDVEGREVGRRGSPTGAWHVARMALYLSWSCLGPLSRAVHCNVGRPELWPLLPTD